MAIDEDSAARGAASAGPGLAVQLREAGPETRHLRAAQPEEIRHVRRPFPGGASRQPTKSMGPDRGPCLAAVKVLAIVPPLL